MIPKHASFRYFATWNVRAALFNTAASTCIQRINTRIIAQCSTHSLIIDMSCCCIVFPFCRFVMDFAPAEGAKFGADVQCVTIGSGRFLRAVLIPALKAIGVNSVIAQPRGHSFSDALLRSTSRTYEVDTVQQSGEVSTETVKVASAGTLGTAEGRKAFLQLADTLPNLRYVGIGITEGGFRADNELFDLLAEFLEAACEAGHTAISIIDTDNVPQNGRALYDLVSKAFKKQQREMPEPVAQRCAWHNTMVDRITSHRSGDALVPRCEPQPAKALVIEDLKGVLPTSLALVPGVLIRPKAGQIEKDHALKLRVANGTHTAAAHLLALSGQSSTTALALQPCYMEFLSALYERDIAPGCVADLELSRAEVDAVWQDWSHRLQHSSFGLSTLFITQNAYTKLGLRLMSSVNAALTSRRLPSEFMTLAVAALLRFITPAQQANSAEIVADSSAVLIGNMENDYSKRYSIDVSGNVRAGWVSKPVEYTAGLTADFGNGVYDFKNSRGSQLLYEAAAAAAAAANTGTSSATAPATAAIHTAVLACMQEQGLAVSSPLAEPFVSAVCTVLQCSDSVLKQLQELVHDVLHGESDTAGHYLTADTVGAVVRAEVQAVEVIDLHTHLLPPSHAPLMLWGIDELLCYHYLVAEYFMTATEIAPDTFHALPKAQQADLIWQGLFIDRSPGTCYYSLKFQAACFCVCCKSVKYLLQLMLTVVTITEHTRSVYILLVFASAL
jgi:mannitol-1-phosphate/altronate dehydrogenase